jgi:hypothetical protein
VETSNSSPAIPALDAIPEKKTDEIKLLTETANIKLQLPVAQLF